MKILISSSFFLLLILYCCLFTIKSHFLSSLLTLEAMVLLLLLFTISFSFYLLESLSVFLFVLTLSVCEATMGLTLLISLVKSKGNDKINSLSFPF
uniref:NADH-ubiquinone oxidoreductase chain 4L n=1 Tax=Zaptyx cladoptyx TaxID=1885675 RepID=A0A224AAP1_9EUPU|nr:NADH dehydrogenase subunit 4L [Zaptyx cladoptyx]